MWNIDLGVHVVRAGQLAGVVFQRPLADVVVLGTRRLDVDIMVLAAMA